MQYEKKIEEIFERHPSVQVSGFSGRAYKSGIEGMIAFDNALGQPWKAFRCIHVAGTNGKGSVSSMIAASLASSGLCVGLYTSPHLLDFRERIKIITNCSGGNPCPQRPCRPRRGRGGTMSEANGEVELPGPSGLLNETSLGTGVSPTLLIRSRKSRRGGEV